MDFLLYVLQLTDPWTTIHKQRTTLQKQWTLLRHEASIQDKRSTGAQDFQKNGRLVDLERNLGVDCILPTEEK